ELQELGFNYRLTDIQAALAASQLTRLDDFVARRREIARCYDEAFAAEPAVEPLSQRPAGRSSYHLYVLSCRGIDRAPAALLPGEFCLPARRLPGSRGLLPAGRHHPALPGHERRAGGTGDLPGAGGREGAAGLNRVAIVQARMGSTRLPGKVLKKLCGRPVLLHVVERLRACRRLDGIVVATTDQPADNIIVDLCRQEGIACCRGSETDVLDRYRQAAREQGAEIVVRITADCPLLDPGLVDRMLAAFAAQAPPAAYLSNTLRRTFPRGLDVEIFTAAALARAWREARSPAEREHVTPYIYRHPELFRLANYEHEVDLAAHRWTLDTPADWELIAAVYRQLYRPDKLFGMTEVLALLERQPQLAGLNRQVRQKETGP
ncbi:MAG: DegT/DnrJ/EryC1/StrS family aminotransferase, partial [Deltaproteobacteria bacterium]|nr:DegT/DnrJ/EryC1/StrS family aminotransferase [Deltaproteobacteria bacterium]